MKNLPLVIGSFFFFIFLIFATIGPFLPFVDSELNIEVIRKDETGIHIPPYPPSTKNILGSDNQGRDMLSILIIGARETLIVVFAAGIMRYLLAIPLGAGAVYSKTLRWILNGWNYLLSFIPPIFLVALFLGIPFIFFSDHLFFWFLFVIAMVEVGRVAEMIKKQINHLSSEPFIEAAVTSGTNNRGLLKRHYLPHLRPHLIQNFVSDLARVLFLMAQLAVVEIFVSREFVSQIGGSYAPKNTSIAYPGFLETIMRDIWTHTWIPYSTVLFISLLIMTFFLLCEGIKIYYKRKYRYLS